MKKKSRQSASAGRLTLAFAWTAIGFTGLIFRQDIAVLLYRDSSRIGIVYAFSVPFLLMGIGAFLYLYLRGEVDFPFLKRLVDVTPSSRFFDPSTASQMEDLELRLSELEDGVTHPSLSAEQLSTEQLASLVQNLKQQLQGVVANDIVKTIEQKYSSKIAEEAQIAQMRKSIDLTTARLEEEVKSLSRRNSLNLSIGAVTTGLAVGMLTYLVLGATQQTFSNVPDLLAHFIPRVSVAAFIEVFSFFFLKLYKAGLQEIKYFQNELTNVEMKGLAIEAALLPIQGSATEKIIPQLINVDRNVVATPSFISGGNGKQLSPKDVIDLLEKFGKLLSSHS